MTDEEKVEKKKTEYEEYVEEVIRDEMRQVAEVRGDLVDEVGLKEEEEAGEKAHNHTRVRARVRRFSRANTPRAAAQGFFAKFVEGYTRAKEAGKGGAGGGNDDKNIATAVSDWASVQITGFLQRGKGDVARDDNGLGGDDEQQTTRIL